MKKGEERGIKKKEGEGRREKMREDERRREKESDVNTYNFRWTPKVLLSSCVVQPSSMLDFAGVCMAFGAAFSLF